MKKQTKKLVLSKETVLALVDAALVRGGAPLGGDTATSCRPYYCPREIID